MTTIQELEHAIATIEAQRGILDDNVVDLAIAAMRKEQEELSKRQTIPKQQRKLITVLFMDIVNSTQLTRDLDPEESLTVMDNILQQLAVPIEAHGGRVTRFMGDGYLSIFGLPLARENDPEMAIRAGLSVINKSKEVAQNLEKNWKLMGFQVRIGINTGLVVSGGTTEADDTIMGNAVNLAARLESLATPGGILISQDTYQHVRGLFEFEKGDRIVVKGFSDPVQVYIIKGVKETTFRTFTRGVEGIETPMLGRDKELKILIDTINSLKSTQEAKFFTFVGEAGWGKSRLLYELESRLNAVGIEFVILKGRAMMESVNVPYGLLKSLISSKLGILDDDSKITIERKLIHGFCELIGDDKDSEIEAIYMGQFLGFDFSENVLVKKIIGNPKILHDRGFKSIIKFFRSLVETIPLIMFIDDIHWADDSSLEIINRLYLELFNQRMLIVSMARPSLFERRSSWSDMDSHQIINLAPLAEKDGKQLVREILRKVEKIPKKLIDLVVSKAEGNPFYIEELIKILIDEAVIQRDTDHWYIASEKLTEIGVPATLTGILQARLDRLPMTQRNILHQAAVVGRIFWDDVLVAINDIKIQSNQLNLPDMLDALTQQGFVRKRSKSKFAEATEYMFVHTMIRDVTYEAVLKKERQEHHRKVAQWLVENSENRMGEFAGMIATHFEAGGMDIQALEYVTKAADIALNNYAVEEAETLYTQALNLTSNDDLEGQYAILLKKDAVSSMSGNREDQLRNLDKLARLADELDDNHKRAEILIRRAWFAFWVSDFETMFRISKDAQTLSESLNDVEFTQKATYANAWALLQRDRLDLALEQAEKSLSLATEINDLREEGNSFSILGLIKINQGEFYTAKVYLDTFLSITKTIGDREREITALNNLTVALTKLGDFDTALEMCKKQKKIAIENGDLVNLSNSYVNMAWVYAGMEDWEAGLRSAQEGIKMKREFEQLEALAEGLMWEGQCWLGLQEFDNAMKAYTEALDLRQALHQTALSMGALAGLARTALGKGNLSDAWSHAQQIVQFLSEGKSLESTWEPLKIYLTCFEVLSLRKDERASKILAEAHQLLQTTAAKIDAEDYKKKFLENVPWHEKIASLWQQYVKN